MRLLLACLTLLFTPGLDPAVTVGREITSPTFVDFLMALKKSVRGEMPLSAGSAMRAPGPAAQPAPFSSPGPEGVLRHILSGAHTIAMKSE